MHGEKEGIMVENSLRDKRILVVDDEPQLRRMIVDVLRAEGFCAISQAGQELLNSPVKPQSRQVSFGTLIAK